MPDDRFSADLDFPVLVSELRSATGLTQEQLARKLDVTFGTVNAWENGRHRPIPALARRLSRMARAAGVEETVARSTGSPAPVQAVTLPPAGWERAASERRDFYHRIREFPEQIQPWRRDLVAWVLEDRLRFPLISKAASPADVRGLVDDGISHLREIAEVLAAVHGNPDLGNKADPVDELVYIILSRKTPDAAYRRAFDALKGHFPEWDSMLRARSATVARLVSSGGLGNKKTDCLLSALRALHDRFGRCTLEPARTWTDDQLEEFLCSLPEVNRKSAYCVMLFAFGRLVFPADAHVGRVLKRLGIYRELGLDLSGLDHKKLQVILPRLVPPTLRRSLHVNLVAHGRDVCRATAPDCENCDLRKLCADYRGRAARRQAAAPRIVDLFCGAGGLAEGFERAGFRTDLAVDSDSMSVRTFRVNHVRLDETRALVGDVTELAAKDVRRIAGRHRLDVLVGAPPCQGFSTVGNRSKRTKHRMRKEVHADERNYLFKAFVRLALELKPRLVLMENVPGMETARVQNKKFSDLARELLEEGGYRTAIWRLDAAAFGVPQERRRIFLVGSATRHLPAQPQPEYQAPSEREFDPDALPPVTLGEAIFDLPALDAGEGTAVMRWPAAPADDRRARRFLDKFGLRNSARVLYNHTVRYHNERDLELYALLEQGEDSYHVLEKGRADLMRYRTEVFDDKYMRLRADWPSKTIVAHLKADGNGYVHPTQNRSLSFREAARVQSFPDDYVFCGSPSDQWSQLGNAVPPVLARAIARSFRAFLERNKTE